MKDTQYMSTVKMLGTSLVKPCDDFMALVAMTSQRDGHGQEKVRF